MSQTNVLKQYSSLMRQLDVAMRTMVPLSNPFKAGDYVVIPVGAEYSDNDEESKRTGEKFTTDLQDVEILSVVTITEPKVSDQHRLLFEDETGETREILLNREILSANGK